jgi:hypothetical protein
VVFSSAAAVGAGVGVMVDSVTDHTQLSDLGAAAAFTIPVMLFMVAVAFIHTLLHGAQKDRLVTYGIAVTLVVASTFTGQPVLFTGVVLAGLVAALVVLNERDLR